MIDIKQAWVYDEETFPNVFTLAAERLFSDETVFFEISDFKDDRRNLSMWCEELRRYQIPMIGFFSLQFDYPILHYIISNPLCTAADIYRKSQEIIGSQNSNRFAHMIWQRDRIAPQIDLFKVNHFDNKAKTTSLKALQVNMRSQVVVDMPVEVGTRLSPDQLYNLVKPYNQHDTAETKQFAHFCMDAINFRIGLSDQIKGDVLNFNDTKIGEQLLEQRIGENICYERVWIKTDFDDAPDGEGRGFWKRHKRQTVRSSIVLNDIIFPYIQFNNPEFSRVLTWLKQQKLTPEELLSEDDIEGGKSGVVATKGVFKGIQANVGDITFYFGTGGIHASVVPQRIVATDEWLIKDVDVAGYYPATAIVNRLAPAHLGDHYVREYGKLPLERKEWQKKKGKKCVEANSLKLAGNGVYGKSNSPFSVFYDPQYTMAVTINCQLLLCMLAEWLLTVPTLKIIQANTDGITYYIHRDYEPMAVEIRDRWQKFTCLELEDVSYKRMFIRDVNNYIAEPIKGDLKQKGAYWHPDPNNYAKSISEAQPPAWHKDLSNVISIRAAVVAMVHGIDPAVFIRTATDPFDFMLRAKVGRESRLMLGNRELQRTSRYYVAIDGDNLHKISPPTKPEGEYKKANGITEHEYQRVMSEIGRGPGNTPIWDARIHTKNKSQYKPAITQFEAGYKVAECNDARSFRFENVNYDYYINEARKLIIS